MELKELYGPRLKRAEDMIRQEGAPCVFLLPDGTFHPGTGTGVRPLLETLDKEPELMRGSILADKIVGKAAAMLAVLGGVRGVYGLTMSEAARAYLAERGIPAAWEVLTENIINRTGTGICPMEETVLDIEDPEVGRAALRATMQRLMAK